MDNVLKVRTYVVIAEGSEDRDYNDLFLTVTAFQREG